MNIVNTATHRGLAPVRVYIEVETRPGVGDVVLPYDTKPKATEARVRIAAAVASLGVPLRDITKGLEAVVVARAGNGAVLPYEAAFDLPALLAVLGAFGRCPPTGDLRYFGELGLDGSLRPVRGALVRSRAGACVVPSDNAVECAVGGETTCAASVREVLASLAGVELQKVPHSAPAFEGRARPVDHSNLDGQAAHVVPEVQRRALELARCGKDVLLVGPPAGRMALARRIADELRSAPLTRDELVTVNGIAGVAGLIGGHSRHVVTERPFRAPHHTVSEAGMVGGGTEPRPGELSLAHGGVLLLDEVDEFRASTIEAVARTQRNGCAEFSRAGQPSIQFPAVPLGVIGTAKACSCGVRRAVCKCPPASRARHIERVEQIATKLNMTVLFTEGES